MVKQQQTALNSNYFEFTGRITFVEVKHALNGTAHTRALISKKKVNSDEYDTYAFTFFGETAEAFADDIKKGDVCNITGYINVDSYEKDGKKIERLQLIGKQYCKAEYDESLKGYVPAAKGKDVPWG